jgi:hypothetical protein
MRTTDLFKNTRSAKRINESIEKTFGKRINLESFDLPKLEDARNKLRTQIHDARSQSGFNENLENETLTQAQWMLDAINAEIAEREEFVSDAGVAEVSTDEGAMSEIAIELAQVADDEDYDKLYDLLSDSGPVGRYLQDKIEEITFETGLHPKDDFEQIEPMLMDIVQQEFGGQNDDEGGETDDNYALASAGFGSDEDYESVDNEAYDMDQLRKDAADRLKTSMDKQSDDRIAKLKADREKEDEPFMAQVGRKIIGGVKGGIKGAARGFSGKEDIEVTEKAVSKSQQQAAGIALAARRKGETPSGKGAAAEMSKMSMKELEKFAGTKHKNLPAKKDESVNTGDDMTKLQEGEIQQASAIVTAKTMVDRVGRWIEELSGMENDTLLQLGDSIRDEMGQEQAKTFISSVAPAIQQALENLKATREALSTGVRTLTGEEQPANMLGDEPEAGGIDDLEAPAEPDMMNAEPEADMGDEFGAAEPAAGGLGDAGRAQRESIERGNNLLRVLAG